MFKKNIWLIGGTRDSATIAKMLTAQGIPVLVTVTTAPAQNLYKPDSCLTVIVAKIPVGKIDEFIIQNQISGIIDASHPYAVNISSAVIEVVRKYGYPYLRYERPPIQSHQPNVVYVSSISSLIAQNYLAQKRVLLTIGCNHLHRLQHYQSQAVLYTRILPYPESITKALQAGFTSDRIIAIRPPLNYKLEKALWQLWQIDTVVSKASGEEGGENLKRQLAQDLEIELIIIQRPQLDYPQLTDNVASVLTFCSQIFSAR
jgi:precorrin-6A/cobalt-precorrin-6A reductase